MKRVAALGTARDQGRRDVRLTDVGALEERRRGGGETANVAERKFFEKNENFLKKNVKLKEKRALIK